MLPKTADSPHRTLSVVSLFVTNGLIFGAWAAQIPSLSERLELSESRLSLVLLAFSIGAVALMVATPALTRRFGSEHLAVIAGIGFVLTIMLPVAAPTFLWAALGAVVFGATNGLMDVSMNAVAVAHEQGRQSPILSRLHGCWSLGAVTGALLGGWLADLSLPPLGYAASAMAAGLIVVTPATMIWNAQRSERRPAPAERASWLAGLPSLLVMIAIVTFSCFLAEGAMADWLAKLMREFGATKFSAAAVYAAFSAGMAVGRFSGDWTSSVIGDHFLVTIGAALAAVCLAVMLLTGTVTVGLPVMFVMGLGIANIVPITFRHAGRVGPDATSSLAFAVTMGYSGLLLGPVVIGFIAELIGLQNALFIVVAGLAGSSGLALYALRDRSAGASSIQT